MRAAGRSVRSTVPASDHPNQVRLGLGLRRRLRRPLLRIAGLHGDGLLGGIRFLRRMATVGHGNGSRIGGKKPRAKAVNSPFRTIPFWNLLWGHLEGKRLHAKIAVYN